MLLLLQFDIYLIYMNLICVIMQFNSRIQDASTFARKLHTEVNSDFKRGPSLAYLEIQRRKILHGIGDKEKLINALVHYFCRCVIRCYI